MAVELPVRGRAPRVLVIYKKSTLQRYRIGRRDRRVEELLEQGDPEMRRIADAHDEHRAAIDQAGAALKSLGARATFRNRWADGDVQGYDLVVTLGGDGTLLWTSHVVSPGTPMLAINSAPKASVGYFAAGRREAMEDTLRQALDGQLKATELTRMRVAVDGETISTRVLNDVLFCHTCPAVTSRYLLRARSVEEEQRSSGIWAGPAAGSTAAIRSAGGDVLPLESPRLQFIVRELYRGGVAGEQRPRVDHGFVEPGEQLWVRSMMRDARLFLDGAHRMHPVDFGSAIELSRSPESLTLLGLHSSVRERDWN